MNTPTGARKHLAQFLEWVQQFEGKDMLYRGLSHDEYSVDASIARRLPKEERKKNTLNDSFVTRTKELVDDARMRGHGIRDGRKLDDLEILAELQHYDAATCLLDFSRNPLVALWFACQPNSGDTKDSFGKVVALDMGDTSICVSIEESQINKPIEKLLSFGKDGERENEDMLFVWAPHHQNERITAQQSVFVFGKPEISDDYLEIHKITKSGIHAELENLGISADSLFCDFHGFARNNAQHITYKSSHEGLYKRAEVAHGKDEFEDALNYYDKAIKLMPKAEYYYGRGRTYAEMEKYPLAVFDYQESINHGIKKDADFYYHLGFAEMRGGDFNGAIKSLNQAIKKSQNFTEAFYARGIAKGQSGNLQDAIKDFDEVLRISPQYTNAFNNRGIVKSELNDFQGAIKDFDEAIRIDPKHVPAFSNRGFAKINLNDLQGAIKDLDKSISINPQNATVFFERGFAKRKLNDLQGAIKDFDEALRINPQDAIAFFNRGFAKGELGDWQGALKDYDEAVRMDPQNATAFNNRGTAKGNLDDLQGAIKDFDKAIHINPQIVGVFFNRALAKFGLGDKQGAQKDMQKAKQLNPDLPSPKWFTPNESKK